MDKITQALQALASARKRAPGVIISYSGGKDSLAVTDMCVRTFERCEAFVMEYVPGLELIDERVDFALKRWGLKVRRYPHWSSINALRNGVFCDSHWTDESLPKATLAHIYAMAREDSGLKLIATGFKRADGVWRKRTMAQVANMRDVVTPIAGFQKVDVLQYLASRRIPVPDSEGSNANGVDLSTPSLLWLHDRHPRDFRRLCEVFPYAEAVVWRRRFYAS